MLTPRQSSVESLASERLLTRQCAAGHGHAGLYSPYRIPPRRPDGLARLFPQFLHCIFHHSTDRHALRVVSHPAEPLETRIKRMHVALNRVRREWWCPSSCKMADTRSVPCSQQWSCAGTASHRCHLLEFVLRSVLGVSLEVILSHFHQTQLHICKQ